MLKYISLLLIFVLIISACKKPSEQSQYSENNDTNKNIIEKINEIPNIEEKTSIINEDNPNETQNENYAKDLLDAIELKLKLQEKLQNLKIECEDEFFSAEEIALLSPDNISQYVNMLFNNSDLRQDAIYHIFKSGLINSLNANDIKNLYSSVTRNIYDTDKNRENIKMLHDYAKNIGDTNLLNILYQNSLDMLKNNINSYSSRAFFLQLSDLYQDDPEKKQEIEFNFYAKNEVETPYEKIEKNFDNFLKNANQNYDSYNKAIEFLSRQKTIEQVLNMLNYMEFKYSRFFTFGLDEKYLENLKNIEEKNEGMLRQIEYLEKYHSLYSNIYQQIKETYQK